MSVTFENHKKFIDLVTKNKLLESNQQMEWIKIGINHVINLDILSLLTWDQLEQRACGVKEVDIIKFKSITDYNTSSDHQMFKWFWEMFESCSSERCVPLEDLGTH